MSKAITSCKKALAYLLTAAMVLGMAVTSPITAVEVKAACVYGVTLAEVSNDLVTLTSAKQKLNDGSESDVKKGAADGANISNAEENNGQITVILTQNDDYYLDFTDAGKPTSTPVNAEWTPDASAKTWTGVFAADDVKNIGNDTNIEISVSASPFRKIVVPSESELTSYINETGVDKYWKIDGKDNSAATVKNSDGLACKAQAVTVSSDKASLTGEAVTDGTQDSLKGLHDGDNDLVFSIVPLIGYELKTLVVTNGGTTGVELPLSEDSGVYKTKAGDLVVDGDIKLEKVVAEPIEYSIITSGVAGGQIVNIGSGKVKHDDGDAGGFKFKINDADYSQGKDIKVEIDSNWGTLASMTNCTWTGDWNGNTEVSDPASLPFDGNTAIVPANADGYVEVPGWAIVDDVTITTEAADTIKVKANSSKDYKVEDTTDTNINYAVSGGRFHTDSTGSAALVFKVKDGTTVVPTTDIDVTVKGYKDGKYVSPDISCTVDSTNKTYTVAAGSLVRSKYDYIEVNVTDNTAVSVTKDSASASDAEIWTGKNEESKSVLPGQAMKNRDFEFSVTTPAGKLLKSITYKKESDTSFKTAVMRKALNGTGYNNGDNVFGDSNSDKLYSDETIASGSNPTAAEVGAQTYSFKLDKSEVTEDIVIKCETEDDKVNLHDVQILEKYNDNGTVKYKYYADKYTVSPTGFGASVTLPGVNASDSSKHSNYFGGMAMLTITDVATNYGIESVKAYDIKANTENDGDENPYLESDLIEITGDRLKSVPTSIEEGSTVRVGIADKTVVFVVDCQADNKVITIDKKSVPTGTTLVVKAGADKASVETVTEKDGKYEVLKDSYVQLIVSNVPASKVVDVKIGGNDMTYDGANKDKNGIGTYYIEKVEEDTTITVSGRDLQYAVRNVSSNSNTFKVEMATTPSGSYSALTTLSSADGTSALYFKAYNGSTLITKNDITAGKYVIKYQIGDNSAVEVAANNINEANSYFTIEQAKVNDKIEISVEYKKYNVTLDATNSDNNLYLTSTTELEKHSDQSKTPQNVMGKVDKNITKPEYSKQYSFVVAESLQKTGTSASTYTPSDSWQACPYDLKVEFKIENSDKDWEECKSANNEYYTIPLKYADGTTDVVVNGNITVRAQKIYKTTVTVDTVASTKIDTSEIRFLVANTAPTEEDDFGTTDASLLKDGTVGYTDLETTVDGSRGVKKVYLYVPFKAGVSGYEFDATIDGKAFTIDATTGISAAIDTYKTNKMIEHEVVIGIKDKEYKVTVNSANLLPTTTYKVIDSEGNEITGTTKTATTKEYTLKSLVDYYVTTTRESEENAVDFGDIEVWYTAITTEAGGTQVNKDGNVTYERWAMPDSTGAVTTVLLNEAGGKDAVNAKHAMPVFVQSDYNTAATATYVIKNTVYGQDSHGDYVFHTPVNSSINPSSANEESTDISTYDTKDVSITVTAVAGREIDEVKAYKCLYSTGTAYDSNSVLEEVEATTTDKKTWTVKGGTFGSATGNTGSAGNAILFKITTKLTQDDNYNINFVMDKNTEKVEVTTTGGADADNAGSGAGGTISKTGVFTTATSGFAHFTVTAKAGYKLSKVKVGNNDAVTFNTDTTTYNGAIELKETDDIGVKKLVAIETAPMAAATDLYFRFDTSDYTSGQIEKIEVTGLTPDYANKTYKIAKGRTEDIVFDITVKNGNYIPEGKIAADAVGIFKAATKRTEITNDDGSYSYKYSFKMGPSLALTTNSSANVKIVTGDGTTVDKAKVIEIESGAVATQTIALSNTGAGNTSFSYKVNGQSVAAIPMNLKKGDVVEITVPKYYNILKDGTVLNANDNRGPEATDKYVLDKIDYKDEAEATTTYAFTNALRTDAASFKITNIKKILNATESVDVAVSDTIESDPGIVYEITTVALDPSGRPVEYVANISMKNAVDGKATDKLDDTHKYSDFTADGDRAGATSTAISSTYANIGKLGKAVSKVKVNDSVKYTVTSTYTDATNKVTKDSVQEIMFNAPEPATKLNVFYNNEKISGNIVNIEAGATNEIITILPLDENDGSLPLSSISYSSVASADNIEVKYNESTGEITVKTTKDAKGETLPVSIVSKATGKELIELQITGVDRVLSVSDLVASATKKELTLSATGAATARTGVEQYYEVSVADPVKGSTKIYNVKATDLSLNNAKIAIDAEANTKLTVSAKMFEVAEGTTVPAEGAYASPLAVSNVVTEDVVVVDVVVNVLTLDKTDLTIKAGGNDKVTVTAQDDKGQAVDDKFILLSDNTTPGIKAVLSGKTITVTVDESIEEDKTAKYTVSAGTKTAEFTVTAKAKPPVPEVPGADIPDDEVLDQGGGTAEEDLLISIEEGYTVLVNNGKSLTYNGKIQTPKVAVSGPNGKLTEGIDFKVYYTQTRDVYEAQLEVRGIGKYTGTIPSVKVPMVGKKLSSAAVQKGTVTGNKDEGYELNNLKVYNGTYLLTEGTDYEVTGEPTVKGKSVSVTITAVKDSNFTGSKTITGIPYIENADTLPEEDVDYELIADAGLTYTGKAIKPYRELNSNCKITYKNNVKAGTAYAIIKGKGAKSGTVIQEFTIDVRPETEEKVEAALKKTSVVYNGKLQMPAVTVKVPNPANTSKMITLKKGTDYTVQYYNNLIVTENEEGGRKATAVIRSIGNYAFDDIPLEFEITPQNISKVSAKVSKGTLIIQYNKRNLIPDVDCKVNIEKSGDKCTITIDGIEGANFMTVNGKSKVLKNKVLTDAQIEHWKTTLDD